MPLPASALLAIVLPWVAAAAPQDDVVTVYVGAVLPDVAPIPPNFVGFSIEVEAAPVMFSVNGTVPRASYANLMRNLQQASRGVGPNLRIGGGSANDNAYIPPPAPLPPGYVHRITDADLALYRPAVSSWNGSVVLDVTFRSATDPALAVAHVAAIGRVVGFDDAFVEAVEVGNEADGMWQSGLRPKYYNVTGFDAEFAMYLAALHVDSVLPAARVQGVVWCCNQPQFDVGLEALISRYGHGAGGAGAFATVSYHRYPVWYIYDQNFSIYWLLSDEASGDFIRYLAPYVATAAAARVPFYVGEGGGASSNGTGVVDVFAVCLWAVDALFNAAELGVQRWNFHGGPCDWLGPIMYCGGGGGAAASSDISDNDDVPEVRPLYYAALLFARASANASAIRAVNVTSTNGYIKAWAVADENGAQRVVLVHKDPRPAAPAHAAITVSLPGVSSGATASVVRLLSGGGGLLAKANITLAGQTFDGSRDGLPVGAYAAEAVRAGSSGLFAFNLPAASVAVLELLAP